MELHPDVKNRSVPKRRGKRIVLYNKANSYNATMKLKSGDKNHARRFLIKRDASEDTCII